jgi:hypothetical protein
MKAARPKITSVRKRSRRIMVEEMNRIVAWACVRAASAASWFWSFDAEAQEQVVLFDVSYSHDADTTSDSHYPVQPSDDTPDNWRAPIDYAGGRVEMYLEVRTKPSDAPTRFQLCFIASPSYACTDQAPVYNETGVVTWTSQFKNFYQYDSVDWSQGVHEYMLILKDHQNGKPAPENVGQEASAQYFPSQVRVVATLVPEGAVYVAPDAEENIDAGAQQMEVADAGGSEPVAPTTSNPPSMPPPANTVSPMPVVSTPLDPGAAPASGSGAVMMSNTPSSAPSPQSSTRGCHLTPVASASSFQLLVALAALGAMSRRRKRH